MLYDDETKQEIIQKFCDVFELTGFSGGVHMMQDVEDLIEKFYVDYVWIARVDHSKLGYFSIGMVKHRPDPTKDSDIKSKAFLLAPLPNLSPNAIVNKAIDVEWEDIVAKALSNVNILPIGHLDYTDLSTIYPTFAIYAATYKGSVHYAYSNFIEDESVQRLWDAILQTKTQLMTAYNNLELVKYFEDFLRRFYQY